jgi:Arc/MetJ-type ribon-helix-helix transcriptional regulator
MKLSVSLTDDDVALIDEYARAAGVSSRSAVLQHAIRLLRNTRLEDDYAAAWNEWSESGEDAAWAPVAADGIADAPR